MREESDSSIELAEHVGREVAARVEAETENPTTPAPDAAKVAAISKDVMAAAIMQLKAEQWDKLEQERKSAETERLALLSVNAREKIRTKWAIRSAAVIAVIGVVVFLVEHFSTHPLH